MLNRLIKKKKKSKQRKARSKQEEESAEADGSAEGFGRLHPPDGETKVHAERDPLTVPGTRFLASQPEQHARRLRRRLPSLLSFPLHFLFLYLSSFFCSPPRAPVTPMPCTSALRGPSASPQVLLAAAVATAIPLATAFLPRSTRLSRVISLAFHSSSTSLLRSRYHILSIAPSLRL